MNREELAFFFDTLVHNYTHMNELPHETAERCKKYGYPMNGYCEFWSDYLLTLSNLVKEVGQEA